MTATRGSILSLAVLLVGCSGDDDPRESTTTNADDGGGDDDDDGNDGGSHGGSDAADALALEDPGSYPVGVTRRLFVDESRPEVHTPDDPDDVRTLVTEIWYPAAESARDASPSPFVEFIGEENRELAVDLFTQGFGLTVEQVQALYDTPTGAVRDAALAEGSGFPVVLFSHGNRSPRWQMFQLTEHLASHGFIVIAPDHTYNAAAAELPGGVVLHTPDSGNFLDVLVEDLSYLLDVAGELDAEDPEGLFTGKVDASRAGVMGQSLGGGTCLGALNTDDRFVAGACIVPVPTSPGPYDDPLMLISGMDERTIAEDIYAEATGPRWHVHVPDAGHLSFTTQCMILPEAPTGCGAGFVDWNVALDIGRYYLTALFGHHFAGDDHSEALEATPFAEATLAVDGLSAN